MTLLDLIQQLSDEHGSMRAAASALGIDVGYLSRLASGEKTEPSAEVLEKLGLNRVVSYTLRASAQPSKPKSLLRAPLKAGEHLVCYCPPGVCQAPKGFSSPCNRASTAAGGDAS